MKLPWKKNDDTDEPGTARAIEHEGAGADAADTGAAGKAVAKPGRGSAYTPKKGRPTPKRNEVRREHGQLRGPIAPPLTAKEARARRKEERASMSKEELKEQKARERAERRDQRRVAEERMAAGDPKYLLPRDQGEERKFVRDWVDSRRFLSNVFMPFALLLLLVLFLAQAFPTLASVSSLISMVFILVLIIEGMWIGRKANQLVRERFPKTTATGFGLGFYAYTRATQPRRLRTPRPQVEIGGEY